MEQETVQTSHWVRQVYTVARDVCVRKCAFSY